jgi:hypothetical protein
MSGRTPSPDEPGGSASESRTRPPAGQNVLAAPDAGTAPRPPAAAEHETTPPGDAAAPPGYAVPPGPPAQPGQERPGYGPGDGYRPPGPDGGYPVPPRGRLRLWLGLIAGFVVIAVIIAGISAYLLHRPRAWTLTAPQTVAGLSRDTRFTDQPGFTRLITEFKSKLTGLPDYGSLKSTVSAIYKLGPSQDAGFIGFNGTFSKQIALKTGASIKVSGVSPGPHGGVAECGSAGPDAVCQWSTSSTVGIVVVIPTSLSAGNETTAHAAHLMIKIRNGVERHAGHG